MNPIRKRRIEQFLLHLLEQAEAIRTLAVAVALEVEAEAEEVNVATTIEEVETE